MPRIFMSNFKKSVILLIILIADQMSKFLVRSVADLSGGINVIGDFLRFVYVRNNGAAFSSFSGQRIFLIILPTLVIIGAIYAMNRYGRNSKLLQTAVLFIIAGGIGNLIDRIIYGYVTDMISFSIFPPVFNIADIAVSVGCGLLFIYVLFFEDRKAKSKK